MPFEKEGWASLSILIAEGGEILQREIGSGGCSNLCTCGTCKIRLTLRAV